MKFTAIAFNTFFEAIRNKVFYIILVFAVVMILFGVALGQISIGNETRVVVEVGLIGIRIFGVLLAMFVGAQLVYDEIERRTLYTLVAHGTPRWQFILGKYLGLFLTILVNILLMGMLLSILILQTASEVMWGRIVHQLLLIGAEMGVVISFAVLFSSFSTPILSAVLTFMIWVIGNATVAIQVWIDILEVHQKRTAMANLLKAVYMPLPHLGVFNVTNDLFDPGAFPVSWFNYTYAVFYTATVLVVAMMIFARRDIR